MMDVKNFKRWTTKPSAKPYLTDLVAQVIEKFNANLTTIKHFLIWLPVQIIILVNVKVMI